VCTASIARAIKKPRVENKMENDKVEYWLGQYGKGDDHVRRKIVHLSKWGKGPVSARPGGEERCLNT
jgi:hypothetical protein